MIKVSFFRITFLILLSGFALSSYVNKQNQLAQIKLSIPTIVKEIKAAKDNSVRLLYEIEKFETPEHLMELARSSEFSHLKHPFLEEILTLKEGIALQFNSPSTIENVSSLEEFKPPIATLLGLVNSQE